VIALAMNPPGNPGFGAGVFGAKFAAGMGAICVHGLTFVRITLSGVRISIIWCSDKYHLARADAGAGRSGFYSLRCHASSYVGIRV
jgi:hypothetical protein